MHTDYVGNMIYENGSLKRILIEGGYIEDGVYHFYIQDHLGNNRVVAKQDGTVVQTNHYYPFGMSFAEGTYSDKQPYKYNGKELDTENGLNLYDSNARFYDPVILRTPTPDLHSENYYSWSPYAWVGNNPMNTTDPTGMDWFRDEDGNMYWYEGSEAREGHTWYGTTASFQVGDDSYLNFYQNAGIQANKAVNAFDLIYSSPRLQKLLLGKDNPLSEDSKSGLFNSLIIQDDNKPFIHRKYL